MYGLGDTQDVLHFDPVGDAVATAKDRVSLASWFGVAMLAGVAWVMFRSGRR